MNYLDSKTSFSVFDLVVLSDTGDLANITENQKKIKLSQKKIRSSVT